MNPPPVNRPLAGYAAFLALATLGLVCIGGLVTSKGVGMAVPDWPTSFGYNMFALPLSTWLVGGVFDEHTHRLWASTVGLLVVMLTRWVGGLPSRRSLLLIGVAEILAGASLLTAGPNWRGEAHFLMGIGGVVLMAGCAWFRNEPATPLLRRLAWAAFWLVQLQGGLGGLRVVLDQWTVAGTTGGMVFGLIHGCLGQAFFVLVCLIALLLSPLWSRWVPRNAPVDAGRPFLLATLLVFLQLVLGALMRHQHAGLAVPDLPLAYGQVWPDTDPESLSRYLARRVDIDALTAFQVRVHMLHRFNAVLTFLAVVFCCVRSRRLLPGHPLRAIAATWAVLLTAQFALGVFTVLTDKSADIATAHVAFGALCLATGTVSVWIVSTARAARGIGLAAVEPVLSAAAISLARRAAS